jgi:hypothetical protein
MTLLPDTVQNSGVFDVYVTGNPDDEVAFNKKLASLMFLLGIDGNAIPCGTLFAIKL